MSLWLPMLPLSSLRPGNGEALQLEKYWSDETSQVSVEGQKGEGSWAFFFFFYLNTWYANGLLNP